MAMRRMISRRLAESDRFLDLPLAARGLYLHLVTSADDDGLLGGVRALLRLAGATERELSALVEAGFLLPLPDGVFAVRHWLSQNKMRRDRYTPTIYSAQFEALGVDQSGNYFLKSSWQPSIGQVKSDQVKSDQVKSDQDSPDQVNPDQVNPDQVRSGQDSPEQDSPGQDSPGQDSPDQGSSRQDGCCRGAAPIPEPSPAGMDGTERDETGIDGTRMEERGMAEPETDLSEQDRLAAYFSRQFGCAMGRSLRQALEARLAEGVSAADIRQAIDRAHAFRPRDPCAYFRTLLRRLTPAPPAPAPAPLADWEKDWLDGMRQRQRQMSAARPAPPGPVQKSPDAACAASGPDG